MYGPRSPPNPHKPSYFIKAVSAVASNSLHNGTSGGSEPPIYHLRQGSESVDQWKIKYNCKFKFGQYSRRMIMLKLNQTRLLQKWHPYQKRLSATNVGRNFQLKTDLCHTSRALDVSKIELISGHRE